MKYIFLMLVLLMPHSAVNATNYPLSPESKQFITNWALAGGIAGGGIGALIAYDKYQEQKISKHACPWDKIKAFPWQYVILPALAGAAGAGFIASFFTTEEYLKSAEKELAMLENNAFLDKAMHTNDAAQLKRMAYNSRYPTLTTYERLEALLAKIKQAQEYLFTVIKSGSSSLGSIAQAALERLKVMEQRISNWMGKLKDSEYFKELDFRTELENAHRATAMAEARARAAENAAWRAMHSHAHHARPVYVAPPAVNVYVKK